MKVSAAAAILWIVLSLLVTSCGAGGSDGAGGDPSTQSEARDRAKSMLLARSDFPGGWKAVPYKQYIAAEQRFRECITPATSEIEIIGGAERIFASDAQTELSGATVFGSAEQASAALRGDKSAVVARCFRDFYAKSLAIEGNTRSSVGQARARVLEIGAPPDVDEAKEWQIATSVTLAPGLTVKNQTDLVTLRRGDAIVSLAMDTGLAPSDPALRDQLLEKLAGRLGSNQ